MRGSYQLGRTVERFSCEHTPDGWQYRGRTDDGDSVELTSDQGLVRRLVADFDGWTVRGGVAGDSVLWVRGEDEHEAVADGFTGTSPAFDLAVAARLALDVGGTATTTLVELTEPVGAARTVRRRWQRLPDPEVDVRQFRVTDLATGEDWLIHLADDVLVNRDGPHPAVLLSLTQ